MGGGLGTASLRLGEVVIGALKVDLARATPHAALRVDDAPFHSTTLAVVATNVAFSKTELTRLAMMADCGAVRAIIPYHTTGDGDQLYALPTMKLQVGVPVSALGAIGGEVLVEAIGYAVKPAKSIEGSPACEDFPPEP